MRTKSTYLWPGIEGDSVGHPTVRQSRDPWQNRAARIGKFRVILAGVR